MQRPFFPTSFSMLYSVITLQFDTTQCELLTRLLNKPQIVPHPTARNQTNTKDNIPPIEETMERKPYGLRIF
jgi:hypothetical protein